MKTENPPFTTAELLEHSSLLKAFAYKLTKDDENARDLLQDTLLKALEKQKLFKGGNLKAWLHTLMRNLFINEYRKKKRRGAHHPLPEEYYQSPSLTVPSQAEENLAVQHINDAVHDLPLQYLTPIYLRLIGFNYYEIAQETGLPEGTVKSRIRRGRNLLAAKLPETTCRVWTTA